jgi:hypothetical protein
MTQAESNQWKGYSSDQVKFIKESFGATCSRLDVASLDPELIDGGGKLRTQLFPGLERVEYQRRGDRHVSTVYVGSKGVAILMESKTGRGQNDPATTPEGEGSALSGTSGENSFLPRAIQAGSRVVSTATKDEPSNLRER